MYDLLLILLGAAVGWPVGVWLRHRKAARR